MYTIELTNWEWVTTRGKADRFWFAGNPLPAVGRFETIREAGEWLERNGFARLLPGYRRGRLSKLYTSPQGGTQAEIIALGRVVSRSNGRSGSGR